MASTLKDVSQRPAQVLELDKLKKKLMKEKKRPKRSLESGNDVTLPQNQKEKEMQWHSMPRPRKKRLKAFDANNANNAINQQEGQMQKRIPDLRYILAPMVGASELAFRLLCRKYGTTLAYTPMMDAARFARDESYRLEQLGIPRTCSSHTSPLPLPFDRPLVCHFNANNPDDFAAAAIAAAPYCDAVDLNLGCPQRTAHVGHFGSYLLGPEDRPLVLSMIAAATQAVPTIPICCKIRLLDTVEETVELVQQLHEAGASWIAIHARYRATWHRKGPGARDGPALLDQIATIRKQLPHVTLVANGNIKSFEDCTQNLDLTQANGVMSAEGILDNPALFLPRYETDVEDIIEIPDVCMSSITEASPSNLDEVNTSLKKMSKVKKKLCQILDAIQGKSTQAEMEALHLKKAKLETKLTKLKQKMEGRCKAPPTKKVSLDYLSKFSSQKVNLALEYLSLVREYPVAIRTIVFHIRRMLRDELTKYQLLDDCIAAPTLEDVLRIVNLVQSYHQHPSSFSYDEEKARRQKEALARKKHEEGKRKRFEERMIRKAKREGKEDLEHYLRVGALIPSKDAIAKLRMLSRDEQLEEWKKHHSQHCMAYHLGKCERERACAFLHVDSQQGNNQFLESEEVAG